MFSVKLLWQRDVGLPNCAHNMFWKHKRHDNRVANLIIPFQILGYFACRCMFRILVHNNHTIVHVPVGDE